MPRRNDLEAPVVRTPSGRLSTRDLLRTFAETDRRADGIGARSDLHVRVGEPVRFRIDGDLVPIEAEPLTEDDVRAIVDAMLSDRDARRLESSETADVDAAIELDDPPLSFRLNVFRDRGGLACAVRVLDASIPDVAALGLPFEQTWREIVDARQGLVIVTGVSGSGKSTTVASLLDRINRTRPVRVVTLEDPIEYVLRSDRAMISQREIGRHVETFASGLRSALREDPDVLFVGEMRDLETAALALTAAETGHLVLSTLHTRDARGALSRLVDMFPYERSAEVRTMLSFGLRFVIAQKLVPRAGGRGRRLVAEVLKNIPAIANHVRRGDLQHVYSALESNRRSGTSTLERHLVDLLRGGEIDHETALRFANDPEQVV